MRDKVKSSLVFLMLLLVLALSVCGFTSEDRDLWKQDEEVLEQQTQNLLDSMTLEQKVYQMFIVTPEMLTDGRAVTAFDETAAGALREYPVGGLIYFSKNLTDAAQTKELLRRTQASALEIEGLPLFQCVDEEGGRVARIGNHKGFEVPKVGAMGKINTEEDAYAAGSTIGAYLRGLGFTLDFAPDADVLTNPQNTAIGDRSFGEDAERVLRCASAYSDGLLA